MELKPGYRQTEVGVIPAEWELSDFDAVGSVIDGDRGTQYPSSEDFSNDGYCLFLNAGNVTKEGFRFSECAFITREKDARLNKGKLKRNDIVLTTRGTVGNLAYFDAAVPFENIRINSGMVILRNASSSFDTTFLYALLQSRLVQMQIERLSFGSAQPQLTVRGISRFGIAVPPLPEQRAIAGALSDVDALIGALDQLIAKKRDLKQAAMQQLLTGQTRLPGFGGAKVNYKQTEVGVIPGNWESRPLLSAVHLPTGQVDPRIEPYKSMVLVAPDHIESRTGRLLERQTASVQHAISGKYLLEPGDIVYSKIRPYLRKAILANFRGLCSADMYPLTPAQDVSSAFMLAVLLGHHFSCFAECVSVRSGIPKINREELAEYVVALPPLPEQTAIATMLSDMDAEISALERRLAKTRALKQGMMQELLTGRTRLV
jgi:type I restriction enzyme S subunit